MVLSLASQQFVFFQGANRKLTYKSPALVIRPHVPSWNLNSLTLTLSIIVYFLLYLKALLHDGFDINGTRTKTDAPARTNILG